MTRFHVLSGVDRLHTVDDLLKGRRVGLMTNPTGIDHELNSTIDLVHQRYQLTALFAVEHGIRGDAPGGGEGGDHGGPRHGGHGVQRLRGQLSFQPGNAGCL